MKKKILIMITCFSLLAIPAFSQVELTIFGQYNLNLSYPDTGTIDPNVASTASIYVDQIEAFINPVLQQQNDLGLGGRIAFNITPTIGIEASIEYIMAKTNFKKDIADNLEDFINTSGYPQYFTLNRAGGNILRYYGNVVINIPSSGGITPYITVGLGVTHFKIEKGTGPEMNYDITPLLTKINVYYKNVSALTFNTGIGAKILFSPNIGLRIDARMFYCKPKFQQKIDSSFLGITIFNKEDGYLQEGTHADASLNFGIFFIF